MFKLWRSIISVFVIFNLSRLIFEQAGSPLTEKQPVTEKELRAEFGSELSEVFYLGFAKAVAWQNQGRTSSAQELYGKLSRLGRNRGMVLYKRLKRYIDHNIKLLP